MAKNINTEKDELETEMDEFFGEPVTKYAGAKSVKAEKDPSREGQIFDVMNSHNVGTTFFRLIPDTVKTIGPSGKPCSRLYRKINNAFVIRVQGPEDKFAVSYNIPCDTDFTSAGFRFDSNQYELLKKVRDAADNISRFMTFDNRKSFEHIAKIIPVCQYNKQIVLLYGKLLKFVGPGKSIEPEEMGKIRVFKFSKGMVGSTDFITVFQTARSTKASIFEGSKAWMSEWFGRKTGKFDKVVVATVSRETDGYKRYSLSVSLDQVAPFEITEHDLELCDNLNSRTFNITKFDEKMYQDCLARLDYVQKQINMLGTKADKATKKPESKGAGDGIDEVPL